MTKVLQGLAFAEMERARNPKRRRRRREDAVVGDMAGEEGESRMNGEDEIERKAPKSRVYVLGQKGFWKVKSRESLYYRISDFQFPIQSVNPTCLACLENVFFL